MKKSAIFGIKNLTHYDTGNLMTFAGLGVAIVGWTIALVGHIIEDSSLSEKQIRFPEDEAVLVTDDIFDNLKETKEV